MNPESKDQSSSDSQLEKDSTDIGKMVTLAYSEPAESNHTSDEKMPLLNTNNLIFASPSKQILQNKDLAMKNAGTLDTEKKSKIIEGEKILAGKIKFAVYIKYMMSIGFFFCVPFLAIYIGSSVLGIFGNLWLAKLSDHVKEVLQ